MSANAKNGGRASDGPQDASGSRVPVNHRSFPKLNERSRKRAEMAEQLAVAQERVRRAREEEARVAAQLAELSRVEEDDEEVEMLAIEHELEDVQMAMDTEVVPDEQGVKRRDAGDIAGCDACCRHGVSCVVVKRRGPLSSCLRCKEKKVRCSLVPPEHAGKRPNRREELKRLRREGTRLNKRRRDSSADSEWDRERPRRSFPNSRRQSYSPQLDAPRSRMFKVQDNIHGEAPENKNEIVSDSEVEQRDNEECDACRDRGVTCVIGRGDLSCSPCKEKKVRCSLVPAKGAPERRHRKKESKRARQDGAKLNKRRRRDSSADSEPNRKHPRNSLRRGDSDSPQLDTPEVRTSNTQDDISGLEHKLRRFEQRLDEREKDNKNLRDAVSLHHRALRKLLCQANQNPDLQKLLKTITEFELQWDAMVEEEEEADIRQPPVEDDPEGGEDPDEAESGTRLDGSGGELEGSREVPSAGEMEDGDGIEVDESTGDRPVKQEPLEAKVKQEPVETTVKQELVELDD
ncbi:hypothetical protein C8R46DRAFT_1108031 [Mycena filopes]|nr:hypothetical protein C8R46DRAFT_1108031 [Mycena filopes]